MFCGKCGFEMADGMKFCPECGEKTAGGPAVPDTDEYDLNRYSRDRSTRDRPARDRYARDGYPAGPSPARINPAPSKTFAIISLVTGLVSVLSFLVGMSYGYEEYPGILTISIGLGIFGIVISEKAKNNARATGGGSPGLAVAGEILSIISLVLSILVLLFLSL